MYLMIQNKGTCSFDALYTLGATSSRNSSNSNIIGQFGSGSLLGVLALLRNNIRPVFYNGLLRLEYFTKTISINTIDGDTSHEVLCVHISGKDNNKSYNKTEQLNVTMDFGSMDWSEVWHGMREIISNAIDASYKLFNNMSGITITPVPDMRGKSGFTRVFLPLETPINDIYKNLHNLFLHFNLSYNPNVVLLGKSLSSKPARFYRKGVFVGESNSKLPSIYDYNIPNLEIDESRNIQQYSANARAAQAIVMADSNIVEQFLNILVESGGSKYYEQQFDYYYLSGSLFDSDIKSKAKTHWLKAFNSFKDVVLSDNTAHLNDLIVSKNKIPMCLHSDPFYKLLNIDFGVPNWTSVITVDEMEGRTFSNPNEFQLNIFDYFWSLFKSRSLALKDKPSLKLFNQNVSTTESYTKDSFIYIRSDVSGDLFNRRLIEQLAAYLCGDNEISTLYRTLLINFVLNTKEDSILMSSHVDCLL